MQDLGSIFALWNELLITHNKGVLSSQAEGKNGYFLVTTWSKRNCVTNNLIKKEKAILLLSSFTSCNNQLLNTCICTVIHGSKYVVRCSRKLDKPEILLETNMSRLMRHHCILNSVIKRFMCTIFDLKENIYWI